MSLPFYKYNANFEKHIFEGKPLKNQSDPDYRSEIA